MVASLSAVTGLAELPRLPVATLSTLAYSHTDAAIESKTNGNILWQSARDPRVLLR